MPAVDPLPTSRGRSLRCALCLLTIIASGKEGRRHGPLASVGRPALRLISQRSAGRSVVRKSLVSVFLVIMSLGFSAAHAAECTGSNTATLVCLANRQVKENLSNARKLGANWRTKYDRFVRGCVRKIGGPEAKESDIGGASRLDLAECVRDRIAAALR